MSNEDDVRGWLMGKVLKVLDALVEEYESDEWLDTEEIDLLFCYEYNFSYVVLVVHIRLRLMYFLWLLQTNEYDEKENDVEIS